MSSGLSLLAIPAGAAAFGFAKQSAAAAAEPFQALLQAAMERAEPVSGAEADEGGAITEVDAIRDRLARQMQELLASSGAAEGEVVSLNVSGAGDISIAGDSELAAAVEAAIRDNPAMADDIRRLAESDGALDDASWFGGAELRITAAAGDGAPELEWRASGGGFFA